MPLLLRSALSWCLVLATAATTIAQEVASAPVPKVPELGRNLAEFGPVSTPTEAQSTYQAAVESLRASGGVLLVPSNLWKQIKPTESLQGLVRTPAAPAETKKWTTGGGVTVVTADAVQTIVEVPPLSGLKIEREFRLDQGDSVPHWGTHPMIKLDSRMIYGSISYLDWIQRPVEKGLDRKFYVPTVRGLAPGQFINVHGNSGYGGGVTRACIKSLGYDAAEQQYYFIADTSIDHKPGAIAHNKSNTGILHMTQTSNADNQTYDVKVIRNQYAHGDTYVYYCDFNYMSNVHSAAGDENGNCYAAFVRTKENNFRGKIEAVDNSARTVTYAAAGVFNVDTLGNSRPLINHNPAKHLTAGKVRIVSGRSEFDSPNPALSTFNGQNYATSLVKNPISNSMERKFGGLIRGDADCPWDENVVGRFFAVNELGERTPKGKNYRWYQITKFTKNDDGTKEIEIQRFWWGAKNAGSPTLYHPDNYTYDGHDKPLAYIIAPGSYVNDVSRAIPGGDRGNLRTLGMAPCTDAGTDFDFAAGDAVEQAIGPDPFKPQVFRTWLWEDVPGQFPAAIFDVSNQGQTSRYSVISVAGGPANLDDVAKRHEPKPAWDNIVVMNSAATVGFNFKADFASTAAMLFTQPNREQPIKWHYGFAPKPEVDPNAPVPTTRNARPTDAVTPPQMASLTVNRQSGEFQFEGGGVQAGGAVSGVAGLSGDSTPAKNLRGKNVAVTGETYTVKFAQPESDGEYAVFLELSWLTERAVTEKTAAGFTMQFSKPAPAGAKLDWMIVR